MRPVVTLMLFGFFPLLALAADAKPKDLIVGKWEVTEGKNKGVILEYKADGKVTVTQGDKTTPTGTYKFVADDVLEFQGEIMGEKAPPIQYRVKVTKDELVTTDEKTKKETTLKRVK
jgi:uncharacterized protein (TIGR03066 family)